MIKDYAQAVRAQLKALEPNEPLLEGTFDVHWRIAVSTTDYADSGDDNWTPDVYVSYTADGYVSAYRGEVFTSVDMNDVCETPMAVALEIGRVYSDTADEAIARKTDYWWGVLTNDESDYPSDYMTLPDLEWEWLGVAIGKTYFRRHAGETVREKVAAYERAEKLVPEGFGLDDAFRELYLIEPDMHAVDAAELIAAELGVGEDFNAVLDIVFDIESGKQADHYRERYGK